MHKASDLSTSLAALASSFVADAPPSELLGTLLTCNSEASALLTYIHSLIQELSPTQTPYMA